MQKTKLSEQKMAFILRQVEEGATVGEVCQKAVISEATYYNRHKKVRWVDLAEMTRLK
ncbi:MAG: transposase [Parvibaculum sp.]|uniref:transposase n=1 Tax=Parvibaculum sp. TaxID=2024848 RepID=UPI003C76DF0A